MQNQSAHNEGERLVIQARRGEGRKGSWLDGWLHSYANKALIPGCSCFSGWSLSHSQQLALECQTPRTGVVPLVISCSPDRPDKELIVTMNQGLLLIYQILLNKGVSLQTAVSSARVKLTAPKAMWALRAEIKVEIGQRKIKGQVKCLRVRELGAQAHSP